MLRVLEDSPHRPKETAMHPDITRQMAADHVKMLVQEAHRARRVRHLLRNPVRRAA
jgi:hypothetical protein